MNPSRNYLLSCYWTPVARAWLIFFASSFQVFIDIDQIPLWAFSYLGCSVLALSTSPHRRATPDPSFYLLFAGVSVPPGLLGSPVFNRRMTTHAGNPWPNTAKNAINFFFLSAMNIVMHINYFWKSLFGKYVFMLQDTGQTLNKWDL